MKKVLYIHHGGNQGGAPRSLAFLIEKLDKTMYEPYVLVISDERNIDFFIRCGAKVIYEPRIEPFHGSTVSGMSYKLFARNILGVIPSWLYIRKIIKEVNPDLVHLNSTCLFVLAHSIKTFFPHLPVVCHIREPLLPNLFGGLLRKGNLASVDYFIAIEEFDAKSVTTDSSKVSVVYNFVDFDMYDHTIVSRVLRDELSLSDEDFIVLYLARFAPQNGTLGLVSEFAKHHDNIHLVLVGASSGDPREYLEAVKEVVDSCDNMHILGFRSDIPELIASSNLLVCPFIEPHFSRSVIEAGAMGKASVISNVGGLSELVLHNKTGMIYPYDDFSQCYNYCHELSQNSKKLHRMNNNAYAYACENFEARNNANKIFKIYDDMFRNEKKEQ